MTVRANAGVACALLATVAVSMGDAQTGIGCRPQQFGRFTEWSQPVSLGPVVNSTNGDQWPAISPNGLSLYFSSNRPGGIGTQDIYVTHRTSLESPWGPPRNLGPNINTAARDNSPNVSRDGHWLTFASSRVEGKCSEHSENDFYISYREDIEDDLGWQPAVNFGCEFSEHGENAGLTFFHDDARGMTTMYFTTSRPGGPGLFDTYTSVRGFSGTFGEPVLVPELSTPLYDASLSVRADGLEMILVYDSPRGPFTDGDLWVSTREDVSQPWSMPTNLGPTINTANDDSFPSLSCDGTTLYFSSNRPGGLGAGGDLYVTTRKRIE